MTPMAPGLDAVIRTANTCRLLPLILLLTISSTGCIWRIGPGAARRGLFYTDVTYPSVLADPPVIEIPYDPESIEIVGWVETRSASLGASAQIPGPKQDLVGVEKSDYATAYQDLMVRYDLDGLIDVVVDTEFHELDIYLAGGRKIGTVIGGVGWRFRPGYRPPLAPLPGQPPYRMPQG